MADEEDYVEVANREMREPFSVKVARAREKMLSPRETDPMKRVKEAKFRRDVDAYKRGLREGWDQAMWFFFGSAVCVWYLISLIPD